HERWLGLRPRLRQRHGVRQPDLGGLARADRDGDRRRGGPRHRARPAARLVRPQQRRDRRHLQRPAGNRRRRRRPHLHRAEGMVELGVAVSALLTSWIAPLLQPLHGWAASRFAPDSAMLAVVRLLLASVLVLPPTLLMGATLPAMTRAFVKRLEGLGRELSLRYAINTAGAVAGNLLAGFILIRAVGVRRTLV